MAYNVPDNVAADSPQKLRGTLGVAAIVFMVVAAAAPLSVLGSATGLGILIGNGIGFPSMFAVSAVILLFFAVGIAAMARQIPRPGAFFTYVGFGLGRSSGLGTAWTAILTYTFMQVAVYAYIGYILAITISDAGGPQLPWWLCSLVIAATVGWLGFRHIDLSSRVLGILLIAEVGVVVVLIGAVVISGGAEGLSLAPFEPSNVISGSPGLGLMFAIAAFIGFEATAIFRDEAKNPDRTIPRATYAAVIGVGVFYTVASWAMVIAWGPDDVVDEAAKDPGTLILRTFATYLGSTTEIVVNLLLITSMFACVLSFHNVLTRYQHSMANAGALPNRLGTVHVRHQSPHISSLAQTAVVVIMLIVFALVRLDPILQVLTWMAGVATLAAVLLMTVTSIAIIVYFARTGLDPRRWNTVIAPGLGLLGLIASGALIVANYPLMVSDVNADGNPTFGPLSWFLLALVAVFPVFGYVQAEWIKRRSPHAYRRLTEAIAGVKQNEPQSTQSKN